MLHSGLIRTVDEVPGRAGMFQPKKINYQAFHYDPCLGKVKEYVDRHYRERLNLQVVAEVAGLERKYFSKFFHEKTGVCFSDWLSWVRVNHAIELMANGDRPLTEQSLTEIAVEVGFHDLRTFERAIENWTGHTPRSVKSSLRSPVSS